MPKKVLKGIVVSDKPNKTITVSVFLLSIAIGNIYTSFINFINERDDGTIILAGANYFLFFS